MTNFIIKYRWWIISICLIPGAVFGFLIPLSETDPDIRNYVPVTLHSRIETDKIESEFGVQDMIVILFSDTFILEKNNLLIIKEIDKAISRLNGVSNRISPFTVRNIKGEEGMIIADRMIKNIPTDSQAICKLTDEILKNRFARDIVISSDMTTASIAATINSQIIETETLKRIDSIISVYPGEGRNSDRWTAVYKTIYNERCQE